MNTHPRRFSRPRRTQRLSAAALMLCAALATAQNEQEGPPPPSQDRAERIEEARRVLPRVTGEQRPVPPTRERATRPVSPGLTAGHDWSDAADPQPPALPEGSYLIERAGHVIPAPNKRWIFVPSADQHAPGQGPLLLLPCAALERLELTIEGTNRTNEKTSGTEKAGATDQETPVRLSGEVFVYRDRRNLLVSSFLPGAGEAPAVIDTPTTPPTTAPTTTDPADPADPVAATRTDAEPARPPPPASLRDDPEVQGLLEELESESPPAGNGRTGAPATASGRGGGPGVGMAVVPDGTPVVRRRGRLVRIHDGAWSFVFDNDEPDSLASRSLTVLPCLLLERMEREAFIEGDAHEMVLSGRVYTYGGQAHLLPTMMVRVRENGISPAQ